MMEELSDVERKAYLIAEEHFKAQFMKGFKKDRGGLVKKVKEFVMPSFKLTSNQVEEIRTVSTPRSDLYQQLSLMMDKKLHTAQTAAVICFIFIIS